MSGPTRILLDESEIPTQWYNIIPDLPSPPPPPLHPGTHEPIGPDDLAPLFPMALIEQEVTTESYVDIPGEVLDVYGEFCVGEVRCSNRFCASCGSFGECLGLYSSPTRRLVGAPR